MGAFNNIMSCNIFGPVPSRRLGRSLGIDLVPYKTCTFDCVYCELGPTTCLTKMRRPYVETDSVCKELAERLGQLKGALDYITFAGSGEPTLNSNLGILIRKIKSMSNYPLALLTNSSLLPDPDIRAEVAPLDLIVPSLDAVNKNTFHAINRPLEGIEIEEIIYGLIRLREEFSGEIWLEVLVCKGINESESELNLIKKAVDKIRPDRIQINTVFRPPSIIGIEPVSEKRLKEIETFMGERAQAVGKDNITRRINLGSRSLRTRMLMLLKRRPCTIDDITNTISMARDDLVNLLAGMMEKGEVSKIYYQGETYYKADGSKEK